MRSTLKLVEKTILTCKMEFSDLIILYLGVFGKTTYGFQIEWYSLIITQTTKETLLLLLLYLRFNPTQVATSIFLIYPLPIPNHNLVCFTCSHIVYSLLFCIISFPRLLLLLFYPFSWRYLVIGSTGPNRIEFWLQILHLLLRPLCKTGNYFPTISSGSIEMGVDL